VRGPGASTLAQSNPVVVERSGSAIRDSRAVRGIAWAAAAVFGAVQVLATPYRPSSEDVVSYLDVADAYRRQDWNGALNGYWSPLYSWALGLAESIVRPSPAWELTFVRLVNFAIFGLALGAFEFFLLQVMASHECAVAAEDARSSRPLSLPPWMWRAAGYSLFLWASLVWTGLRTDTPDLCAAALMLAAAGLLVRTQTTGLSYAGAAALGASAGLSYLARTANFPIALLVIACLLGRHARRRLPQTALAMCAFAVVALPFVAGLSEAKHRLTIGDSGRMNYVWNVYPGGYIVPGLHWQGGPGEAGTPIHPTRRIWTTPDVFEFAHGRQTYPPWTDPSYWYDGLQVHFNAAAQLRTVVANLQFSAGMFLPAVAVLYAAIAFLGGFIASIRALVFQEWRLLLLAAAGLATYMFGTNLSAANIPTQPSTRYIAVFIVMLFAALASSIRLPDFAGSRRLLTALTLTAAVLLSGRLALWTVRNAGSVAAPAPATRLMEVAAGLSAAGIGPESPVAILGRKGQHEFWARLGRIRIIGQVPDPDAFLHAAPDVQEQVLDVLAGTGAVALVADQWAAGHRGQSWQRLGRSDYFMIGLGGRQRR